MGQYWPDDVACECGPFVIEPVSVNTDKIDVTVRELKLTFQPQVGQGRKVKDDDADLLCTSCARVPLVGAVSLCMNDVIAPIKRIH